MEPKRDQLFLDKELATLEVTAADFSIRFIPDATVRAKYMESARNVSAELREAVKNEKMTMQVAAKQAQEMRNVLMNAMRGQSSDFGAAMASFMKKEGKTLAELEQKYATELFKNNFESLAVSQKNAVWCKIVEKSGTPQVRVNSAARWMRRAGRGLFALTAIIAVYHIAKSENKLKATAREGAAIGGGLAGSATLGAAGLMCGPAAIACVPLGIFVGGLVGATGADWAFTRIWGF